MESNNLQSYIQYESYDRAIERMKTPEQKYKMYRIIADYGLYGKEPEFTGDELVDMALEFVIPLLTSSIKRKETARINGSFGGAPKGNQNAKKQPKTTKEQPKTTKNKLNVNVNANANKNINVNDNVNVNANDNVNVNVNDNVNDINTLPPDDEDDDWFIPYQDENGKWITAGEEDLDV